MQRLRVVNLGGFRQAVAVLHLGRAKIPEITAHARLGRWESLLPQQLNELRLPIDRVLVEEPGNGSPTLVLFEGCAGHRREEGVNKIAHRLAGMRKFASVVFGSDFRSGRTS